MRQLHIIPAHKDYPWSAYIQVKNGFLYSANNTEVVRISAEEVFGKKVVKDDEVLFFDKALWEQSQIDSASKVIRNGNVFQSILKGRIIGLLMPSGSVGDTENSLQTGNAKILFPDFEAQLKAVNGEHKYRIGLNANSLFNIGEAIGITNMVLLRDTVADSAPYTVLAYDQTESTAVGMSSVLDKLSYEIVENGDLGGVDTDLDIEVLENELQKAKERIEELEEQLKDKKSELEVFESQDFREIDLCGGKLTYAADSLFVEEIMDLFTETMSEAAHPRELLESFKLMS